MCVYLPCRGDTLDVYQEILDEIHEVITKYSECSTILIGGDMKASVLRYTSQDNLFMKCIKENSLYIPDLCGHTNTFHHYNGRDHSQIDYFLQNRDAVNTYITFIREALNTSTHDPVMVKLSCNFYTKPMDRSASSQALPRIKWNKLDRAAYYTEVETKLQSLFPSNVVITEDNLPVTIQTVTQILSEVSTKHSRTKSESSCKPKRKQIPWTPQKKIKYSLPSAKLQEDLLTSIILYYST